MRVACGCRNVFLHEVWHGLASVKGQTQTLCKLQIQDLELTVSDFNGDQELLQNRVYVSCPLGMRLVFLKPASCLLARLGHMNLVPYQSCIVMFQEPPRARAAEAAVTELLAGLPASKRAPRVYVSHTGASCSVLLKMHHILPPTDAVHLTFWRPALCNTPARWNNNHHNYSNSLCP